MIRLLTIRQAAEVLGCSERTVRRRIAAREIAVVRDGGLVRIATSALSAYVGAKTIPAGPSGPRSAAPRRHALYDETTHHPNGRVRRLYDEPASPPAGKRT